MARGRRRKQRDGARTPRRNAAPARGNRLRTPLVGALAAVPVGLGLAAALVLAGQHAAAGPAGGAAAAPGGEPPTAADDFFADAQAAPADGPADGPTGGAAEPPAQASAAEAAGTLTASAAPSPSPEDGADGDGDGGDPGSGGAGDPPASAQAVVELTNRERAEAGCAPLRVDGALTRASQAHSEDMAARDYMGHETPEGVGPAERAEDAGYTAWSGENVAAGYGSAEAVMAGWMDSPGHRANILNCDNTEIGVGESDARWTQNFGRD